jgi:hypothetical protein
MASAERSGPLVDRRTFLKGAGVATGTAAVGLGGGRFTPVQQAQAQSWEQVGKSAFSAIAGGPITLSWALYDEWQSLQADGPADGLSASALQNDSYKTVRTRQSTNGSTIVDNQNILVGLDHVAYSEAKIAAIEELNAGSQKSAVKTAAQDAIDAY